MKCYGIDQQGGKGAANYAESVMPTLLSDSHGTPHAIAYVIDPIASNSMKSRNPFSGFHRSEHCVTLDTSTQNPIRNGGGMCIVNGCDTDIQRIRFRIPLEDK